MHHTNRYFFIVAAVLFTAVMVYEGVNVVTPIASKDDYQKAEDKKVQVASTLQADHCYIDEWTRDPEFSFEKKYTYTDNILYVVEVDSGKGALVAQPAPDCNFTAPESYKCEYWFRSMPFDKPFLISQYTRETKCPPQFTRENMLKRLKAYREAGRFQVN